MRVITIAFACLLTACGSGIADSALLGELTDEEATALCEELATDTPNEIECGSKKYSFTFTAGIDPADCDDATASFDADCTATAGDMRACIAALEALTEADVCDPDPKAKDDSLPECDAFFDCAFSGAG